MGIKAADREKWNKLEKNTVVLHHFQGCNPIDFIIHLSQDLSHNLFEVQGRAKRIPACLNFPALFLPTDIGSQCTAHHP